MGSGDKILDSIRNDCDKNINAINSDCAKRCEEILSEGRAEAQKAASEAAAKAFQKASQLRAAAVSRAQLEQRNALLKRRRREIDITFDAIYDYLVNLDGENYYNIIYKLASKSSCKEGTILLNKKDLQSLPKNFEAELAKRGIKATVSKAPVDITGGFILKCGDIEENMSFSAILADKHDEIEDLINRELFAE